MNPAPLVKSYLKQICFLFLFLPSLSQGQSSSEATSEGNCPAGSRSFRTEAAEVRITEDISLRANFERCHGNIAQSSRTCCQIQDLLNDSNDTIVLRPGTYTILADGFLYLNSSSRPVAQLICRGLVNIRGPISSRQYETQIMGRRSLGDLGDSSITFNRESLAFLRDGLVSRSLNTLRVRYEQETRGENLVVRFCPQYDEQKYAEIIERRNLLALANQSQDESRFAGRLHRGLVVEEASVHGLR